MLDINLIRENPEVVRDSLRRRQMDAGVVDALLELDKERRALLAETETLKAERNRVSKEIGQMKDAAERQARIESTRELGDKISALDAQVAGVEEKLQALTQVIPNIPDEKTPLGKDEHDNVVVKTYGKMPEFDFTPEPHWDLGPEIGDHRFRERRKADRLALLRAERGGGTACSAR